MKSDNHYKALDQFVLYWGEMASEWGINRTMAQIHALLFAESEPLDTDAIMEHLGISRGNANMNLRRLMQWGIVQKVHLKGKRKDYFTSEKDVWNTAARIIKERHHREISPIKANLKQCVDLLASTPDDDPDARAFRGRIEQFIAFMDLFEDFIETMLPYINEKNHKMLQMLMQIAGNQNNQSGDDR